MKVWFFVAAALAALVTLAWAVRAHACDPAPEGQGRFFCNLHGLTAAQRAEHAALLLELRAAVRERHELDDGFAFRVDTAKLDLARLARWMDLERRCCPFFRFAIESAPDGGPTWLRVTGAPGVKDFIREGLAG